MSERVWTVATWVATWLFRWAGRLERQAARLYGWTSDHKARAWLAANMDERP